MYAQILLFHDVRPILEVLRRRLQHYRWDAGVDEATAACVHLRIIFKALPLHVLRVLINGCLPLGGLRTLPKFASLDAMLSAESALNIASRVPFFFRRCGNPECACRYRGGRPRARTIAATLA